MNDDAQRALQAKLLAALARREHSRAELWRKYSQDFEHQLLEATLDHFAAKDWQSDVRFAEVFVRHGVGKGQGRLKLQHALEQHGIDSELINQLLTEVDWHEVISTVYRRKYAQPYKDIKDKAKRQRFLAQRGFTFDDINAVMDNDSNNP